MLEIRNLGHHVFIVDDYWEHVCPLQSIKHFRSKASGIRTFLSNDTLLI